MTLNFEDMTAVGQFGDTCETPILDLRKLCPDEVLANIPRFFDRWEDDTNMTLILDENWGETAAEGTCDFVTFSSELLECTIILPDQNRIAAGYSDVDYMQLLTKFCNAKGIRNYPTLFNDSGGFAPADYVIGEEFVKYLASDLRRVYMKKLLNEAWNGDQANANEIHGILTQLTDGPISAGDGCEIYEPVALNWSTLTGTGGSTATVPSGTIAAASDSITIHGEAFAGLTGLNMVEFLRLWIERLMQYDFAAWATEEIMFELWVGRGQATCIAELAACMQPCDGCVNPMSDPQIRDRAAEFRKDKVIWLYPYNDVPIVIRQSPVLADRMLLVPKSIGGNPMIGWVFRDQQAQLAILNGEMPYYGAEFGTPDTTRLYPANENEAVRAFEERGFSINVQKNNNCIDYWMNSESAILLFGWDTWLDFTYVDCAGLIPEECVDDMGIVTTDCAVVDGDTLTLTVAGLEAYGTVGAGDTYLVYGTDGYTVMLVTVVSYDTGTDALVVDFSGAVDCDTGGSMTGATVVKLADN